MRIIFGWISIAVNFDWNNALNNIRYFAMGSEDDLMISWQRTKTLLFKIVIINRIMCFYKLERSFSAHNSWTIFGWNAFAVKELSTNSQCMTGSFANASKLPFEADDWFDLIGRSIAKFINRQQATKIIRNKNDRKVYLLMSFVKFTFEFENRNPDIIERLSNLFSNVFEHLFHLEVWMFLLAWFWKWFSCLVRSHRNVMKFDFFQFFSQIRVCQCWQESNSEFGFLNFRIFLCGNAKNEDGRGKIYAQRKEERSFL